MWAGHETTSYIRYIVHITNDIIIIGNLYTKTSEVNRVKSSA